MLRSADEGAGPWTGLRCAQPLLGAALVCEPMYWMSDAEGDEEGSTFESDYFDEMGSSVSAVSGLSLGTGWSEGDRSD